MTKWRCTVCGYTYDPATGDADGGIAPGTEFADIPETWVCPVCGATKSDFEAVAEQQGEVVRRYANDALTVIWQPAKCNHNGNCTRSLPAVFEVRRRPWVDINGASPDEIKRVVEQCPTGALTWEPTK